MQNKPDDVRAVSDEQASTMVVVDEGSLDEVGGGCPSDPLVIVKPCDPCNRESKSCKGMRFPPVSIC